MIVILSFSFDQCPDNLWARQHKFSECKSRFPTITKTLNLRIIILLVANMRPIFLLLTKIQILAKIRIFDQNLDFWPKFGFMTKICMFDQNLDFWTKFGFLTKIWIFDQNLDFWTKSACLTKISIFDQNFDFWPRFGFLTKIAIFELLKPIFKRYKQFLKCICNHTLK